jgi:hypothetical protein
MPCPVRRMRLSLHHRCDHPPRRFWEHAATKFRTISGSARLLLRALRNYFPTESKPFAETIDAAAEGESAQHTLQQCRSRNNHFGAPGEPPLDFICSGLMMLMPRAYGPQSCSSYREEKRAACLSGITRAFFAQCFSGPLDRVCRKTRSVFGGNRHK